MVTRTKIVCTIGPAVNTVEKMIQLIKAGMSVARINFSHGTYEEHQQIIDNLKEARRQLNVPLAIMVDTKGPEIRLGQIKDKQVMLPKGHRWLLVKEKIEGTTEKISVLPGFILDSLNKGTTILFDDGYISSHVVEITPEGVLVEIDNGGVIKSGKGVNIPNVKFNLPAMTEKDMVDIRFACKNDVEIIAASFVRSAEHVLEIKKLLSEEKQPNILVVAKIENSEGVYNFDSIVQVADGIMIARGDLGVEVPLSQVPRLQKMMIRKSYLAGKPSVTATQMLESMIHNPRPTRAEVSDVANAIYDSTSAVMLSGETAIGNYPLETVQIMSNIVKEAEQDFNYRIFFEQHSALVFHDVLSAITLASVKTAYNAGAQAIFAFTSGGATARLISRLRPGMPIIGITPNVKTYHQMAFNWGVIPVLVEAVPTVIEAFSKISEYSLNNGLVNYGDLVVITAGSPFGISGTTNMMIVENIGDVLVRGYIGHGKRVQGNIAIILSSEKINAAEVNGKVIVITQCNDSYLPLLSEAAGIILQNHIDDVTSEKFGLRMAKSLDKPILIRADAACDILKEGQLVTLAPDKALVYNRIVL